MVKLQNNYYELKIRAWRRFLKRCHQNCNKVQKKVNKNTLKKSRKENATRKKYPNIYQTIYYKYIAFQNINILFGLEYIIRF